MAKIYQLDIDGVIGFDVTPESIKSKLKLADGEPIEVRFSSPGGFIFPGLQIFNLFRNYQGKKTARIVGLAASMASYIPMAFDEVIAEDNSVFMIHNARQGVAGDHNDMKKAADLLERMSNMLADAYVKKTGKDKKEIQKMMDAETFLFGQEIVDYGFADKLIKSEKPLDRVEIESQAQEDFENCMTMLKEADKSEFENAVALLESENNIEVDDTEEEIPEEPENKLSTHTNEKSPAVNAGENKERFKKMNLDEFLNQNPDARAEYDKRIKASAEAVENRIAAVTPYLGNKDYEKATPMAMQALKGDIEMSSFQGAIAAFDMLRAQNVEAAAETDTKEIGDTKAGDIKQPSANGDAKKPEDISSAVSEAKSMLAGVI